MLRSSSRKAEAVVESTTVLNGQRLQDRRCTEDGGWVGEDGGWVGEAVQPEVGLVHGRRSF